MLRLISVNYYATTNTNQIQWKQKQLHIFSTVSNILISLNAVDIMMCCFFSWYRPNPPLGNGLKSFISLYSL